MPVFVPKEKYESGKAIKPVIARPWSQMYDKRNKSRRIRSPNPDSHLLARGYEDLSKVFTNVDDLK